MFVEVADLPAVTSFKFMKSVTFKIKAKNPKKSKIVKRCDSDAKFEYSSQGCDIDKIAFDVTLQESLFKGLPNYD